MLQLVCLVMLVLALECLEWLLFLFLKSFLLIVQIYATGCVGFRPMYSEMI